MTPLLVISWALWGIAVLLALNLTLGFRHLARTGAGIPNSVAALVLSGWIVAFVFLTVPTTRPHFIWVLPATLLVTQILVTTRLPLVGSLLWTPVFLLSTLFTRIVLLGVGVEPRWLGAVPGPLRPPLVRDLEDSRLAHGTTHSEMAQRIRLNPVAVRRRLSLRYWILHKIYPLMSHLELLCELLIEGNEQTYEWFMSRLPRRHWAADLARTRPDTTFDSVVRVTLIGERPTDEKGDPIMDDLDYKIAEILSRCWRFDFTPNGGRLDAAQYVKVSMDIQDRFKALYAGSDPWYSSRLQT